MQQIKDTFQG